MSDIMGKADSGERMSSQTLLGPPPSILARPRSSKFDLQSVARSQRAVVWREAARSFFPGVTIRGCIPAPDTGSISGGRFGPGSLWTVVTPAASMSFRPQDEDAAAHSCLTLLLLLRGTMAGEQRSRRCELQPGDLCLIDEAAPFSLEVREGSAQFILLRMPRWMVIDRFPYLRDATIHPWGSDRPETGLVRKLLLDLHESLPRLDPHQAEVAFAGVTQFVGLLKAPDARLEKRATGRVKQALDYIDSRLSDTTLTARDVAEAQGVTRRHLDDLMLRETGAPISAHIWQRRLAKAAMDLRNPQLASLSVTRIALDAGFECAAHFTRAFKKRYGCTPREWRRRDDAAPFAGITRSGSSALPS